LRLLFAGAEADGVVLAHLMQRHILIRVKEELRAFCRLFAEYVLTHQTDSGAPEGVFVDVARGEVSVNGRPVKTLTRLEYLLARLFYENRNTIVDKCQIVVGVWGDDHLPEVDDARIEKLISRLRQKVEPDPANPVHILTVRGRGYRLVSD
jgi:two-component system response regulator RegX3